VLFFNAFELGAENANHVFLKEALRSTAEVFFLPGNSSRKLLDGAVMMVWKLLLPSMATAIENF
jgi:hypothetical protein